MEKKKNNAVEKVENIETEVKKEKNKPKKKRSVKKSKQAREKERAMKEKIRAEKRVELARIKAHKKAEKEKAKAAALREKNRRKAEIKAHKAQLKAEREERKAMLKKESKQERHNRKSQERKERAERRKQRREQNKGYGGWLAAVISLGVATLVLSSVLTFTFMMPTSNDTALESAYRKSFYDTVEQVDNIDLNLSKALATKDGSAMQIYLVDTAINSELAENDLQQLPLQDESKYYTTKLINQIGDYAKYLNKKLARGEQLSESDIEGLTRLYQANKTFKQTLQTMMDEMSLDYSFTSMVGGGNGNLVIENFNQLQNLSVEYPELIYDGPFSDGVENREIKGLKGGSIDENQAKDIFVTIFNEYDLTNVENVGVSSGTLECYNVQADVKDELLYAQVSKMGGKLIMFSYAGSCNSQEISGEQAEKVAQDFLKKNGVEDMKAVWINLSNNVYTINFAYEQDGVIVYSDLIKVRVCAETSMVIGMEAISYYTNHVDRVIDKPVLTKSQAIEKVSDNIEVDTARLVVVPIGTSTERLCYEFSGNYDGSTYYVFIDAINGRQVEMFKVIESTEGTLLM